MINLPIEIGDVILTGKFRNKKVVVKEIGTDDNNQPTVNGRGILSIRIKKIMPTKVNLDEYKRGRYTGLKLDKESITMEEFIEEINKHTEIQFRYDNTQYLFNGFVDTVRVELAVWGTEHNILIKKMMRPIAFAVKGKEIKFPKKLYTSKEFEQFLKHHINLNIKLPGIDENTKKIQEKTMTNIKEALLKPTSLKAIDRKIKWGTETTLPFSQGYAINSVKKKYKMPAIEWGYSGNYIGVGTKKQRMFWKDTGTELVFCGILNKDGTIPESLVNEAPTSQNDPKIQRVVNQINDLIASAKDSDGDPLGVIDTSSTWEEPVVYEPLVYSNGALKITTKKTYGTGVNVDFIKKSNMEFDGIPTLRSIMKMYKKAIKDNNSGKTITESHRDVNIREDKGKFFVYSNIDNKPVINKYGYNTLQHAHVSAVFKGYNVVSESKRNSKMSLKEVISKGVFVTIKKEDGKFWFYIDTVDGPECISNVGFPTKEAAEHAALTKGFNVEKGGNAEDELPETVEVPKPSKRETTKGTEKPKEFDLGKEKEIKLEHMVKFIIRDEIEKFAKKYPNLKESLQKKNLTEAPELTEQVEEALNQLKEYQDILAEADAKIQEIKKQFDYNNVSKKIDKLLKEELWNFFEELKKDNVRIIQLKNIIMKINRFQAEPATYNYEKVLDFVMTQVNQDVKLKILMELKACETIGRTKGNVSFTQTEGIGDIWNSIKTYFQRLIPSLQSKGKKIDNNIQKLQNIVDKMK